MTVVVFDLDDTLYEEINFVKSGFQAVASFVNLKYGIPQEEAFLTMIEELEKNGRGLVFDYLLKKYNLFSLGNVNRCLTVYRTHTPHIELLPDAIRCIKRLGTEYPLYIVTDGNKLVQQNKLKALKLFSLMKFCYITHRYGIKHAKPSTYVFRKICEKEEVLNTDVIYVGDNPHKDFIGIKSEGFQTVRILRGNFANVIKPEEYEAKCQIHTLDELTQQLINKILKNPVK